MTSLLILFLGYLVSAAQEPLPFSGKFNTIYLAGTYMSITEENSEMRMLMREVKFFNQYKAMSMKFYVRKNGKCQLHTVWVDKLKWHFCSFLRYLVKTVNCTKTKKTNILSGAWSVRDASLHFSKIYYHPSYAGGLARRPSNVYMEIHFVSNTTILFEVKYTNYLNYPVNLTGALATGTNITQEMWEEYVKLNQQLRIPIGNIENVYESDSCPKLEL